jgi:triacylglycerol lipase
LVLRKLCSTGRLAWNVLYPRLRVRIEEPKKMSEAKDLNLNRHPDREHTNGKAKQMFNVLRAVRSSRFYVHAPAVRRLPRELPSTEIYDPGIAQNRSRKATQPKRPSMLNALSELRVPLEASIYWVGALARPWPHAQPENVKVVMLIPGFLAGDLTLAPLANFCRWLGHCAVHAGILSNSECPRETMRKLDERLVLAYKKFEQPIVAIGHSLGGVYAREIARKQPEMVERVITLGSPIRQLRLHTNLAVEAVARSVAAIRGKARGCLSKECQCGLMLSDESPADVPTTHIYSRTDGLVHWESCIDLSGAPRVENVEVMGSHVGMGLNVEVYRVIADRLALPRRSRRNQVVHPPPPRGVDFRRLR